MPVCSLVQRVGGIEDRLDDAIHVLRNHAEAGFPSSTPSAIPGDPQISAFHSSYAPQLNPMSDAMLNGCTVIMIFIFCYFLALSIILTGNYY